MPTPITPSSSIVSRTSAFFALAFLLVGVLPFVLSAEAAQMRLYDAHYEGEIKGFAFDTVRSLYQEDDNTYSFISVSERPLAYLRESSRMKMLNGILVPMQYAYKAKIMGISRDHTIGFNWFTKKAYYERPDKPKRNREIGIAAGHLDPLSLQLELQRAAVAGLASIEISYVRKDKVRTETYRRSPSGFILELEGKKLPTVKYSAEFRGKSSEVFLVPALSFAIGKIVYTDDDGEDRRRQPQSYQ